jgi:hypothetical protein
MTATRVDDVLTYLVAAAVAAQATTLAGVTVQDGPWPAAYSVVDPEFLIVGGDFEPANAGQSAVSATQTRSLMGNNSMEEELTVRCVVVSQSGDTAMGPRRARAVAITEAFEDLLTADQKLGGLLQSAATLSVDGVRQVQNSRGAYCALNFTVGASALIWNG